MLGVGLHSYGFMDEALRPLSGFIASQLVLVVLAVSPRRLRSGASAARAERAGPRSPACSS
jgi:hypothetical protein